MAVIVNGDGILTGISSLATALTDLTSGRGTVTGVATVGTLQLGTGVSMSSPRSQNAAIFTNNTEFLTVDDAGRVGVGTVTPNSDAHPQNVGKINVGFITARSVAGDIDGNTLVVAGLSTFVGNVNLGGGNIVLGDSGGGSDDRLIFGAGTDLSIFHDGTNSRINSATGIFNIQSDDFRVTDAANSLTAFKIDPDGATDLRYNGSVKLQTSSAGGTLTGDFTFTGNIYAGNHITIQDSDGSSDMLKIGASEDIRIYHYNNNSYIRQHTDLPLVIGGTTTGQSLYLQPKSGENSAIFKPNAEVELYHDNVIKFETGGSFNYIYGIASGNPAGLAVRNTNTASNYDHASLRLESKNNAAYGTVYADIANASLRLGYETTGNTFNVFNDGTVRGAGIKFGSDTAAANTLDDYEEGTHTFSDATGASLTITNNNPGKYTKVGRMVNMTFDLTYPSNSDGNLSKVTSPFTASTGYANGWVGWTELGRPMAVHISGTQVFFMDNNSTSGNAKHLTNAELSGKRFIGGFMLMV